LTFQQIINLLILYFWFSSSHLSHSVSLYPKIFTVLCFCAFTYYPFLSCSLRVVIFLRFFTIIWFSRCIVISLKKITWWR